MENTLVISDRLFIMASAFFKVDNTEWLNEKELIYEESEDEFINRFGAALNSLALRFVDILSVIYNLLFAKAKRVYITLLKPVSGYDNGPDTGFYDLYEAWDDEPATFNYNGFYSRPKRYDNSGSDDSGDGDDNNFFKKLLSLVIPLFSKADSDYTGDKGHAKRRMYRGNSLDAVE